MFALVLQSTLVDLHKFAAEHEYEDKRPCRMLQVQADKYTIRLYVMYFPDRGANAPYATCMTTPLMRGVNSASFDRSAGRMFQSEVGRL